MKSSLRDAAIVQHPQSRTVYMSVRMHCQLEFVGDTATLQVTGSLGNFHGETLVIVCADIPNAFARCGRTFMASVSSAPRPPFRLMHAYFGAPPPLTATALRPYPASHDRRAGPPHCLNPATFHPRARSVR